MTKLVVGFDSAWTSTNAGAIVAVLLDGNGITHELGLPDVANFPTAEKKILSWQAEHRPESTIVFLDQPTIVTNPAGQRPVEHIVSSVVCRRYGAIQPANTSKLEMFGSEAPIWPFLERFGGAANLSTRVDIMVFETYPVLAIIAFDWVLPDRERLAGRLPKYNPQRRKTFALADWKHICRRIGDALNVAGATSLAQWANILSELQKPRKSDQDRLDACICLLGAMAMAKQQRILIVGNYHTGYMVVPYSQPLGEELDIRCRATDRSPSEWVTDLSVFF
jgi:predicted RNase H-like nuclease